MTREEIKEAAKVMEAYADGKKVQKQDINGLWIDCDNPMFDWASFNYRIKPGPKYRPFESQEECWQEMHQHPDFGWVIRTGVYLNVFDVYGDAIHTPEDQHGIDFDDAFNELTFTDGTPFGIKEG